MLDKGVVRVRLVPLQRSPPVSQIPTPSVPPCDGPWCRQSGRSGMFLDAGHLHADAVAGLGGRASPPAAAAHGGARGGGAAPEDEILAPGVVELPSPRTALKLARRWRGWPWAWAPGSLHGAAHRSGHGEVAGVRRPVSRRRGRRRWRPWRSGPRGRAARMSWPSRARTVPGRAATSARAGRVEALEPETASRPRRWPRALAPRRAPRGAALGPALRGTTARRCESHGVAAHRLLLGDDARSRRRWSPGSALVALPGGALACRRSSPWSRTTCVPPSRSATRSSPRCPGPRPGTVEETEAARGARVRAPGALKDAP